MNLDAAFVHSDAWIFLLARDDTYHAQAVSVLRELSERESALITSSAVVLEVGDALAKRNLREASWLFHAFLDAPRVEVVTVDALWLQRGWNLFEARPDVRWSLTECLSFAIMHGFGLFDALSLEPHFGQAGFRALLR